MIVQRQKAAAVYGYQAASSHNESHLGRVDWRYECWRPAGRLGGSRGRDGLRRSKQGSQTAYWVGLRRHLRLGAAALRAGTAAVVDRVGRDRRAWSWVFRVVSSQRSSCCYPLPAEGEVSSNGRAELTLQRTGGCVGCVSHSESTVLSTQPCARLCCYCACLW